MAKILLFVLVPLVLLIGGGAGYFLLYSKGAAPKPSAVDLDIPPPAERAPKQNAAYLIIDDFVVNLRSDRPDPIFMQVGLTLELKDPAIQQAVQPFLPRIRDAAIVYLSSLTPEQVHGIDGIDLVRAELWKRIRRIVAPQPLENIQITKMQVK